MLEIDLRVRTGWVQPNLIVLIPLDLIAKSLGEIVLDEPPQQDVANLGCQ